MEPVLKSSVSELTRWWAFVFRFLYCVYDIYVPSVLGLSHTDSLSSHVPVLCMYHLWTSLQWHTWEIQGSRDVASMRDKEEDVKTISPCSQKPRMLSKPRRMERGAKFNQSILELLSLNSLLEKHLIFLYGTIRIYEIWEPSQVALILILWVDMCASHP